MNGVSYFFTHIPKTAGTSVRKYLMYRNIPEEERCHTHGLRELLQRNWNGCRWLEGHHPYGLHYLMRGLHCRPVYFTLLRDPIERAVSFYYFLREAKHDTYEHPEHCVAAEHSLTSFFEINRHQNIQTRFIAGLLWHRARNHVPARLLDPFIVRAAKRNLLTKYHCFGLTEQHDISIQMFANEFGWSYSLPERQVKKTSARPAVEDLSKQEIERLEQVHQMDVELYQFAQKHFDTQPAYQRLITS